LGPVGLVFRAELRRRWRSWLALAGLIALVGGLVLGATAAGRRTATAFPRFVAAHGYDYAVVNTDPMPKLAKLPEVASVLETSIPGTGQPTCACTHRINIEDFSLFPLSAQQLPKVVKLVAGRMPDQSKTDEVLASFTMQRDFGIHIGSVISVPFYARSQKAEALNGVGTPTGPTIALHVVGIAADELGFVTTNGGEGPFYDVYGTQALARTVSPHAPVIALYFVRLRHGAGDVPRFASDVAGLNPSFTIGLDGTAVSVTSAIHPQAVGWWVLAVLAALAGLVVIGQALARQSVIESEEYPTLATLGLLPRQLARLAMARTVTVAVVGTLGAVAVAAALSPLTPVGEARLAEPSTGFSFDPVVLLLGALAMAALVVALGVWPALRAVRPRRADADRPSGRPSSIVTGLGAAGAPPSALIGVRHALGRGGGRSTVPVGTALFGTVLAVTALCATAVFGASLSRLTSTPALFGEVYQFEVSGIPPTDQKTVATLLTKLEHDRAVTGITLGTSQEISVNGKTVDTLAGTAIRGPILLSMVNGDFPRRDNQISLGVTTMHQVGAHIGSSVRVSVPTPAGGTNTTAFRVVSTVSMPGDVGSGGLGTGAAMTLPALFDAACPPAPSRASCEKTVNQSIVHAVLVSTVPGATGRAAAAHYVAAYSADSATGPSTPTSLVNFGEAVNFPLILGVVLALFGAATLLHLLVVSVVRRRREMGLLKALGFVNHQVAATVSWQATTVALVGIVVGIPLGVALGQVAWRAFATDLGVVPSSSVPPWLVVALAGGVIVVANLLAIAPALAARSRPAGQLLRTQ
jgi:hypothetical protein